MKRSLQSMLIISLFALIIIYFPLVDIDHISLAWVKTHGCGQIHQDWWLGHQSTDNLH